MSKTLQLLLSILLLSIFTSCASKVPFKKQEPLKGNALLYLYVPNQVTDAPEVDTDASYSVKIGNERIPTSLTDGEFIFFNIKPSNTTITIEKNAILKHKLTLSLKANHTYYLKISKTDEGDNFTLEKISSSIALPQINKTVLAGSRLISKDEINTNIIKDKKKPAQASKVQEIEKVFELREKGIITQEEFQRLKEEILSK